MSTEPTASLTAAETKFSLGIISRSDCCRSSSARIRAKISGSVICNAVVMERIIKDFGILV